MLVPSWAKITSSRVVVTALVIMVALFDAALDLSAVQTMCFLARTQNPAREAIGRLFYHTNQPDEIQQRLPIEIETENSELRQALQNADSSYLSFRTFSGQAQNLIAMAVIFVFYLASISVYQLFKQFKALF